MNVFIHILSKAHSVPGSVFCKGWSALKFLYPLGRPYTKCGQIWELVRMWILDLDLESTF